MKAFKFSLQSVLEFRNDVEEEKKMKYQASIEKHKQATLTLDELRQELEKLNLYFRNSTRINIAELQRFQQYRTQLEQQITLQSGVVFELNQIMNKCKGELIYAKQDVKVLETLKEKQLETHQQDVKQFENKQLDELACIKFSSM